MLSVEYMSMFLKFLSHLWGSVLITNGQIGIWGYLTLGSRGVQKEMEF